MRLFSKNRLKESYSDEDLSLIEDDEDEVQIEGTPS